MVLSQRLIPDVVSGRQSVPKVWSEIEMYVITLMKTELYVYKATLRLILRLTLRSRYVRMAY